MALTESAGLGVQRLVPMLFGQSRMATGVGGCARSQQQLQLEVVLASR